MEGAIALTVEEDAYYTRLFIENPTWSTRHPNQEEARRLARLVPLLTRAAEHSAALGRREMRILDLGCGRGWLTHIASAYGPCTGVDPVAPVVEFARTQFPGLTFEAGTAGDLLDAGAAGTFDLVIASEVIEHAGRGAEDQFVEQIRSLLVPDGQALVTTDRGEIYERWRRTGGPHQPKEHWLTERELRGLFERHGFRVSGFDRAYYATPRLSPAHRLLESPRVVRGVSALRQRWLLEGLHFLAASCQLWLFTRDG